MSTENSPTNDTQTWTAPLPGLGIKGILKVVAEAFKGPPKPPPWSIVLVAITAIAAIVGIVLTIGFTASGNSIGATASAIGSFVLLLVAMVALIAIVIVHARRRAPDPASIPARPRPKWSRLVPKEPPSGDLLEDLKPLLREICREAHDFLEEQKRDTKNWPATYTPSREDVRANVFLPDLSSLVTSGTYELKIQEALCCHMLAMNPEDEKRATDEKRLSFFPSQGLTGVTFLGKDFQTDQVQLKPGRKTLGWSPRFKLTEDQISALHPELKWIVSFPLTIMDRDVRRALGVLNIDGLIPEIDELGLKALEPILNNLSYRMIPLVASFADKLSSGLEKGRLSVYLEDGDV